MELGLKIPQKERTKTTNSILTSLINQLEKDKKALTLGPEDNLYLEGFALDVFANADKQYRAGQADLNTAKTFYAASIFLEILSQFGELKPEIEQKHKYAVERAADIRKALKDVHQDPSVKAPTALESADSSHQHSAPEAATNTYRPPPEKIFDDVSGAVDFLKKSLHLLTNPSAQY